MRSVQIILGITLVMSVFIIAPLFNQPALESQVRDINYYGTITLRISDDVAIGNESEISDDYLQADLDFHSDVRPTIIQAYLIWEDRGAVEIGTLFKQSKQWRWMFSLDTIVDGTNPYYVLLVGSHGPSFIEYKSFTFYITEG